MMRIMPRPYMEDREIEEGFKKLVYIEDPMQIARGEFEHLKREVAQLHKTNEFYEALLFHLENRIIILESENKKLKVSENLKTESNQNARLLRKMFNLPQLEEREDETDVIAEMKGILEDYLEDGMDSVEMLHFYRGE